MSSQAKKVSSYNIANVLTVIRILFIPLFLFCFFHDPDKQSIWRLAATVVFCLAIITDYADGKIARKYNLITDFGKIADPIADKLLIAAALISLSLVHDVWPIATVTIVLRELIVTLSRFIVIKYEVIAASAGGKLKTVLQSFAIILYLIPWTYSVPFLDVFAFVIMTAAVVITVYTGAVYLYEVFKILQTRKKQ